MPINDLQWRAMWLVTLRGMSYEEVGKLLFISERSVRRYVEHFFSTGNAQPSEFHYTTLRIQYAYTLENHTTTITQVQ